MTVQILRMVQILQSQAVTHTGCTSTAFLISPVEQFLYFLHALFLLCLLIFLFLFFFSLSLLLSLLLSSAPPDPSLIFTLVAETEMDEENELGSEQETE